MSKVKLGASAAAALLYVWQPTAQAVENGAPITPFGVMDFGAGQLPPPSDVGTVGLRFATYRATELRDNDGNVAATKPDLRVDSVGVAFIRMTDYTLGSAKFVASVPPLVKITSSGRQPSCDAIDSRAVSRTRRAARPSA